MVDLRIANSWIVHLGKTLELAQNSLKYRKNLFIKLGKFTVV